MEKRITVKTIMRQRLLMRWALGSHTLRCVGSLWRIMPAADTGMNA